MTSSRMCMSRVNPYSGRMYGVVCSRLFVISVIDIHFLSLESP